MTFQPCWRALTPKRLDLLRYVRHHEVRTVKALAADLRRDYKNVHKDVEDLTRLGLLTRAAAQVGTRNIIPWEDDKAMESGAVSPLGSWRERHGLSQSALAEATADRSPPDR